jgi:hypothetical protein
VDGSTVASSHQHKRSMRMSKLRLFVTYDSAQRAPCSIEVARDAQAWTFELYLTVQTALAAVQPSKPLPNTRNQIPNNWMLQGFDDEQSLRILNTPLPCHPPLGPLENRTSHGSVLLATKPFAKSWRQALISHKATLALLLHGIECALFVLQVSQV